uniref:Uncharacterized protein AlNc14C19G2010 n=1 Tax=Albugo laibachii Nc14 TaxID=890382 RepID=F0W539_9STRA|nr:conserved hypothetical protein [Albugo laibachii Nc14]|eukprot:CCA16230.1 conserved hypothetical protein [Albugo laibachii Nc14]
MQSAQSRKIDRLWEQLQAENSVRNKKQSPSDPCSHAESIPVERLATDLQILADNEPGAWNLTHELNILNDQNRVVRKKAALALQRQYFDRDTTFTIPKDELEMMGKPLFKRFNDPVEKIREVCIRLVTLSISQEEDLMLQLPYLMPAITKRMQSQYVFDEENNVFTRDKYLHEAFKRGRVVIERNGAVLKPQEPSEEIRLLFFELIDTLLNCTFQRNSSSLLHAYIFDILLLLVSGINDPFHDINIKCCEILARISNEMVSVMKVFSVAFVRGVKRLLDHHLTRVRIAAIDCIQVLVTCPDHSKCRGSGTDAIDDLLGHREENVIPVASFYSPEVRINMFAKLNQDGNVLVRKHFYAMIIDWMWNLPNHFDYEAKLMPYLLSALSDENISISNAAFEALEQMGKRYEEERGEEIIEMKQYDIDGRNPAFNYHQPLPPPFGNKRPSLASKLFVRSRTRRFLTTVLKELDNWRSPTKKHAARLLKNVIVYSEESITVDTHSILQMLLARWKDSELRPDLEDIAELTGRFSSPDTYMDLVLGLIGVRSVKTQCMTSDLIQSVLGILERLIAGSLDRCVLPHIEEIVNVISEPLILTFSKEEVKRCLVNVSHLLCEILSRRGSDAVTAHFLGCGRTHSMDQMMERIAYILLHFVDVQNKSPSQVSIRAQHSIQLLVKLHGYGNSSALYERYFDTLWKKLLDNLQIGSLEKASTECLALTTLTAIQDLCGQVSTKYLQADTIQSQIHKVIEEMEIFEADSNDESRISEHINMLRALKHGSLKENARKTLLE